MVPTSVGTGEWVSALTEGTVRERGLSPSCAAGVTPSVRSTVQRLAWTTNPGLSRAAQRSRRQVTHRPIQTQCLMTRANLSGRIDRGSAVPPDRQPYLTRAVCAGWCPLTRLTASRGISAPASPQGAAPEITSGAGASFSRTSAMTG
jgi:hypothetical protein